MTLKNSYIVSSMMPCTVSLAGKCVPIIPRLPQSFSCIMVSWINYGPIGKDRVRSTQKTSILYRRLSRCPQQTTCLKNYWSFRNNQGACAWNTVILVMRSTKHSRVSFVSSNTYRAAKRGVGQRRGGGRFSLCGLFVFTFCCTNVYRTSCAFLVVQN